MKRSERAENDWAAIEREFDALEAMAGDGWHYAYVAGGLAVAALLVAAVVLFLPMGNG